MKRTRRSPPVSSSGVLAVLPFLAAAAWGVEAPQDKGSGKAATLSEQITIRGKGAPGPALSPPPASPEKPVLDEVEKSLRILREDFPDTASKANISGAPRRLSRPFPEAPYLVFSPRSYPHPHDRWTFEVLGNGRRVYFIEGRGAIEDAIRWDGSDDTGRMAARVGEAYSFRFTGFKGDEESSVASEAVELGSLSFREALGGVRLEVANVLLFPTGRAALLESAGPYLDEMAERMRRRSPRNRPYRIIVYQKDPGSKVAKARAAALAGAFSRALLVNPERIELDVLSIGERGDATACVLPPEEGRLVPPE